MNYLLILFSSLVFSVTGCQKPPTNGDQPKEYNKPADLNLFGFYLESVLETEGKYNAEFLNKLVRDKDVLYTDEPMEEIKSIYEKTASKITEYGLGRVGPVGPIGPRPPIPGPCICIPVDRSIRSLLVEDFYQSYSVTVFNKKYEELMNFKSDEFGKSKIDGFKTLPVDFSELKGEHILVVQRTDKAKKTSAYAINAYF